MELFKETRSLFPPPSCLLLGWEEDEEEERGWLQRCSHPAGLPWARGCGAPMEGAEALADAIPSPCAAETSPGVGRASGACSEAPGRTQTSCCALLLRSSLPAENSVFVITPRNKARIFRGAKVIPSLKTCFKPEEAILGCMFPSPQAGQEEDGGP